MKPKTTLPSPMGPFWCADIRDRRQSTLRPENRDAPPPGAAPMIALLLGDLESACQSRSRALGILPDAASSDAASRRPATRCRTQSSVSPPAAAETKRKIPAIKERAERHMQDHRRIGEHAHVQPSRGAASGRKARIMTSVTARTARMTSAKTPKSSKEIRAVGEVVLLAKSAASCDFGLNEEMLTQVRSRRVVAATIAVITPEVSAIAGQGQEARIDPRERSDRTERWSCIRSAREIRKRAYAAEDPCPARQVTGLAPASRRGRM